MKRCLPDVSWPSWTWRCGYLPAWDWTVSNSPPMGEGPKRPHRSPRVYWLLILGRSGVTFPSVEQPLIHCLALVNDLLPTLRLRGHHKVWREGDLLGWRNDVIGRQEWDERGKRVTVHAIARLYGAEWIQEAPQCARPEAYLTSRASSAWN